MGTGPSTQPQQVLDIETQWLIKFLSKSLWGLLAESGTRPPFLNPNLTLNQVKAHTSLQSPMWVCSVECSLSFPDYSSLKASLSLIFSPVHCGGGVPGKPSGGNQEKSWGGASSKAAMVQQQARGPRDRGSVRVQLR